MALLKTSDDLGHVIRQRRKALGWDQARLAERAGVSRQWIIDIEKGKPRAEMHLVLRVMNVLGLRLSADAPPADRIPSMHQAPDIDAVVAAHRRPGLASPAPSSTRHAHPSTSGVVDYNRIMDEIKQELGPVPEWPAGKPAESKPLPTGKRGK